VVWGTDLCDSGGTVFRDLGMPLAWPSPGLIADGREQAGRIAAFREAHPDVPVGPVGRLVQAHIPAGDGAGRGAGLTITRETWKQLLDDADAALDPDEMPAPSGDP
jgi:hypothetical protein